MGDRQPQIINLKMPDGSIRKWDMANEPKPDSVGNQSRNGFLYNCYTHPMGRFFQETIKRGLEGIIRRIHDKEIPRYDKHAYEYDDPRIQAITELLKGLMVKHIDDNDTVRKHELFGAFVDIIGFMCKEDVFYRARVIESLKDLALAYQSAPELFTLTPEETYNYLKFNGMGIISTRDAVWKSFPTIEEMKADPESVMRWKAIHNPTGKQVIEVGHP
jgi:hypothetical protein